MRFLGKKKHKNVLGRGGFWILVFVLFITALIVLLSRKIEKTEVLLQHIQVNTSHDIFPVKDSLVVPYVYDGVDILDQIPIEERKHKFIDVILPSVLIVRRELMQERNRVQELQSRLNNNKVPDPEDTAYLNALLEEYHAVDIHDLVLRLTPHPVSIALAQSALESGWGTSRFFEDGNNVFGVWSFDSNEARMMAAYRRDGDAVYLKRYENILESVAGYFRILATVKLYSDFREKRYETDNVFELIWYLKNYSEKRNGYVILLRNVIVANDLTKYDDYQLHPDYFGYPEDESDLF